MVQSVDGKTLAAMLVHASASLNAEKQKINELNVFPVPDGDTGTNMGLTLGTAAAELRQKAPTTAAQASALCASAMLRGARGNSGVILSLIFRGFSRAMKDKDTMDGIDLADALNAGVVAAYKAVLKPAEGTVLTVARLAGDRAGRAAEADPYLTAPWSGEAASMAHIDRAVLARLRTMDEVDWAALPDGGAAEGLPARLARSARTADSLEDFYARAKTKRYPHARLRRLALAAFLGLRAAERPPVAPYVRVLGLSGRGRELLRRMKETCALPVVVKPAQARALDGDARALFEAEARRTDLFGLCFPTARPCGLEWTRSPVVKERQG